MAKVVWNPGALLAPVAPTMVSCGSMEHPNIITIAWTGILSTHPTMTYISVRPQRFSHKLIADSGEFVINLTTRELVRACDTCGVKSGAQVNKFELMGLTPKRASQVSAPLIGESPINLECRVTQRLPMGSHEVFIAKIVAVNVEESLLDAAGKLDLQKCGLVAYAHGNYYALGESLGSFGYSVRKKPLDSRTPQNQRKGRGTHADRRQKPISGHGARTHSGGRPRRKAAGNPQ